MGQSPDPEFILHALVVDDNPGHRCAIGAMLRAMNCTVDVAENGQQAVELACRAAYDLILMDISMPIMDGLEAARRIRDFETGAGRSPAPLFMVTSHDDALHRALATKAGATGHVAKPVCPTALLQVVYDTAAGQRPPLTRPKDQSSFVRGAGDGWIDLGEPITPSAGSCPQRGWDIPPISEREALRGLYDVGKYAGHGG